MKRFSCPICTNELHFDNDVCLSCNSLVVYQPLDEVFLPLPVNTGPDTIRPCGNREVIRCNWVVLPGEGDFCRACAHNRTVPDVSIAQNVRNWREIELAKRYLFYSILKWDLPHPLRTPETPNGLAFDFLADTVDADGMVEQVLTGHDNGLITLNIAEGDDAERVSRREAMGEPYRTLIGHMRHEVGHYYWDRLIRDGGRLEDFRAMFGDESVDYGEALEAHYQNGPRPGWQQSHISSYAASHPWEDWAETWAHYIHIVDATETAHAFEMTIKPCRFGGQEVEISADPYHGVDFDVLMGNWIPLTVALNCLNRSIGQPDMYPFVLSEPVIEKLRFIHEVVGSVS